MRLYHHPQSANARRAVMTALHLDARSTSSSSTSPRARSESPSFCA